MNELVEALRRAVRAEIAAASATPLSDGSRPTTSLAERMEVERCWAQAARIADALSKESRRIERIERPLGVPMGPP